MAENRLGTGTQRPGLLDQLPGELLMWVLIISELLVFGAGLAAFLAVRITDPAGFAEAQAHFAGATRTAK